MYEIFKAPGSMPLLNRIPIKSQLRLVVLIMGLPMAGLILFLGLKARQRAVEDATRDLARLGDAVRAEQAGQVASTRQLLTVLAHLPIIRNREAKPVARLFEDLCARNPALSNLGVADRSGRVWAAAVPSSAPFQIGDRRYFQQALRRGRLASGEYVVSRATGRPSLNFGFPVVDAAGQVTDILSIGFHLESFKGVLERSRMPSGAILTFVDHRGVILYRAPDALGRVGTPFDARTMAEIQGFPDEEIHVGRSALLGERRIILTYKLRLEGETEPYLIIRGGIPLDAVLAGANRSILRNLSFMGLVWLLAFLAANAVAKRSILAPVGTLREASLRLARGEGRGAIADRIQGGELGELAATFDDMARQLRHREAALEESNARLEATLALAFDGYWSNDAEGRILDVNDAYCRITGWSREEIVGRFIPEFDVLDSVETVRERIALSRREGVIQFRSRHRKADGSRAEVEVRVALDPRTDRCLCFFRDITAALRAEEALRASEERFEVAFEASPDAISLSTLQEGRYLLVNEGFCAVSGRTREEVVGQLAVDLGIWLDPQERDQWVTQLRASGQVASMEVRLCRKDGTPFDALLSARVIRLGGEDVCLSVTRDITPLKRAAAERRRLEAELDHFQKLESLGRLAGGVAHDMNNTLAAILAVTEVLRIQRAGDAALMGSVSLVEQAAGRGREMVKSLLGFTRKEITQPVPVDVNAMVRQEMGLLDRTLLKKYELVMDLAEDLPAITGEPGSLGGALMNLCVNAADAMPGGGRLRIVTRRGPAGWVELVVEDTGEGMTPEVLRRAMEPFYTTKPTGKGTGLGLSQVFNTARAHGGYLRLESEPGQGTRAILGLACDSGPAPAAGSGPAPRERAPMDILLVDDEDLIRSALPPLLEAHGHRVRAVPGGREALRELDRAGAPDLVLLDMNMPEMNGLETLGAIRARFPSLPILVGTGYLEREAEEVLEADPRAGAITKPYTVEEIGRALDGLEAG
ncbi:hypothetical protein METESE_18110 [Mesoterricola sediminis]|uniref:histidine kinase n=2 Tax=Mesoterricola sediminis TaxID=2927980 RepID=A0AA48KFW5_9BACT|nr:hypothetical protein METESE_18110 [Mesoterricola sediminis]